MVLATLPQNNIRYRSKLDCTSMTNYIVHVVSQRTLCCTETQTCCSNTHCNTWLHVVSEAHTKPHHGNTRHALSTTARNTRHTSQRTREHTRTHRPSQRTILLLRTRKKIDDIMYRVTGDFVGAPGLCWDQRLRPDHLTVVTVRLRDAPAHRPKKTH